MDSNSDRCELHCYQDRPHGFFNHRGKPNTDFDDMLTKAYGFLVSLGYLPRKHTD